jgi:hypothetical protein
MKLELARFAVLLSLGGAALAASAAPPVYLTLDHSNEALIDAATVQALWKEAIPAKSYKLYSYRRWGFVSEVEGGFNSAKICIVTAHAMMVPRSGKSLIYKPSEEAVAFDALPGATQEQCKALAKTKLKEAMDGVFLGIVAPAN